MTVSLTFDDGLNPETNVNAREWNAKILQHLRLAGINSMVFPSLANTGRGEGLLLIREWSAAGHSVGNHTSRHLNLSSSRVTVDAFIQQVKEAESAFKGLPTWIPMLRFPYLKEGNTVEKRDGVRSWMKANDYLPAPVSIDASDWYFNDVYLKVLATGNAANLELLQSQYLKHLVDRAIYYDDLADKALGRRPIHVMLLHVNAINAAWLPKVVEAFRALNWNIVSARQAFLDPVYADPPDTMPAGESIIWAKAKAAGISGLRSPAEDSVYEEPTLRALGLVP